LAADPELVARLRHPLGYPSELRAAAAEFGVDPLLLAALIRQESLWDARAVSIADAVGLTQVIPPTGAAIAQALGRPTFHVEHLFDPALSLRFGAFYLREQLDTHGSPVRALAAYNAGPRNAARWAEGAVDDADFVANIDFTETRDYVERVVENWLQYRALYGR
jgi:soluble lytic murein transglycosylase